MRLHDIQVVISASNAVNRYQNVYQHQAQAARMQDALQYNEEVEKRMTQAREAEQQPASKAVDENDRHFRQWKKEPDMEEKRQARNKEEKEKEEEIKERLPAVAGYIIDIKA